ncbi:MAG: site-specific DNA-methyltransferase [Calditrichaeota bacterium]|nr:site-specific DNA-methyltransferase [Calditrichota bacterium]
MPQNAKYIAPISTVGRSKTVKKYKGLIKQPFYRNDFVDLCHGNSLEHYHRWPSPMTIVSDGGYGILGFEGDTSNHLGLPSWYESHIAEWSKKATPQTTLWFWNSEIGWAAVNPILEKYGWHYINCNIWDKGKGHIAGNVNTKKIRRFPVVTEVCIQYVFEARIAGLPLKEWLRNEWKRTGLHFRKANEACGVKDAATRKYLDNSHLWYFPPPEMFEKLARYANEFGNPEGRPYFSADGVRPIMGVEWQKYRAKFNCPHGYTNVWSRGSLNGNERIKAPQQNSKAAHLNQKPLDMMRLIIEASSDKNDIVWEPFGGLFSASLAATLTGRKAFSCEIDEAYFRLGVERFLNLGFLRKLV